MTPSYCGRFAPSPTGPLHLGSIVAALASYLDARCNLGRWFVRIDDLDRPRTVKGADSLILHELERLGLEWDGPVVYQSHGTEGYEAAVQKLLQEGSAFHCGCTRREVGRRRYPGTCRAGIPAGRLPRSIRARVEGDSTIEFSDRFQGHHTIDLPSSIGDFIIKRADNVPAYHLATVLDDYALGVTDVIRGADLLEPTASQLHLMRLLNLDAPRYGHVPVALDEHRRKLSKAAAAQATSTSPPQRILLAVLRFLNQPIPEGARDVAVAELLANAVEAWDPSVVSRVREAVLE